MVLIESFFSSYLDIQDLPDGYAFSYRWSTALATQLLTLIELLRENDPALVIELECEPNQGPIWLRLRGSLEIKEQIQFALDHVRK